MPPAKAIKQMALKYSIYSTSFKASKGWMEKFLARHSLSRKYRNFKADQKPLGMQSSSDRKCEYVNPEDPVQSKQFQVVDDLSELENSEEEDEDGDEHSEEDTEECEEEDLEDQIVKGEYSSQE